MKFYKWDGALADMGVELDEIFGNTRCFNG